MEINLDKLEILVRERYSELQRQAEDDEFWINYCDKHEIILLHPEWVREEFNRGHENMVCVFSPEEGYDYPLWLLVPKELAEKSLALNGLP